MKSNITYRTRNLRKRIRVLKKKLVREKTKNNSCDLDIKNYMGFSVVFRRNSADQEVLKHSFDNDIFFTGVSEYKPATTDIIMDVGAHIGTYSLLAASKVPNGKVYAIEPSKQSFNFLKINCALNPKLNIIPHRLALTDADGTVTLFHDRENWGHSITKEFPGPGEIVPALSLASYFIENAIDNVSFAKFNCEGAEFPIIMTAPLHIIGRIKTILVLYHLDLVYAYTLDGLIDRLASSGFEVSIRNQKSLRGWIVATAKR